MLLPVQLLKRKPDTHKGDYGYVLVLGASLGLTGSVCLAAKAALRSGCGLVRVGVPSSLNPIIEAKLTEAMSLRLAQTQNSSLSLKAFDQIIPWLNKIDAIVLGCGASLDKSTQALMLKVVKEINKPLVVDADGLNAISNNISILKKRKTKNLILTPHLGEFSRLIKKPVSLIKKNRQKFAREFAKKYGLVLVLKGHKTIVADAKTCFINNSGNPGMATAGSGDVLSGIIASFLARKLDTFLCAKLGVYLHGLAADYAVKDKTQNCLIASDIIDYLSFAFKHGKIKGK